MTGAVVALALAAGDEASRRVAGELFPEAGLLAFGPADARPPAPLGGRLFEALGRLTRGDCVGLVAPVLWCGPAGGAGPAAPLPPAPDALFALGDHVNLELRGPLTGRWPAGVPRDFPSMTGIYQPAVVRARGGARVYSSGVVAAGVADARRLTGFEARAVREGGFCIVSDLLVPVAIVAAYHGLKLAACGIPRGPARDRE